MENESVWFQKYRPQTINDCVLPKDIKNQFKKFISAGEIPNLILTGPPGCGKTTAAKALVRELGYDSMVLNASLHRNIETLRGTITEYASTVSFTEGRKFLILDEADNLNAQSTQPALRTFMEEFSNNCGFILSCNYINRLISPLHSRCSIIDFVTPKDELTDMIKGVIIMMTNILKKEGAEFDLKAVALLVTTLYPDIRRTINELQRYATAGKVDMGVVASLKDESIDALVTTIKNRQFKEMRQWVGENSDLDFSHIMSKLLVALEPELAATSYAGLILTLNKYDFQSSFCMNKEVNTVACLLELMSDLRFK